MVVGANLDDGGGESLQVVGPTALDSQAIVTDGSGNLSINAAGSVTINDTTNDCVVSLFTTTNEAGITLQTRVSLGSAPATINERNGKDLSLTPGTDESLVAGSLLLGNSSNHKVLIGGTTPGGSVLRITGLPTGAGTPPGGLSAGDLWVDTTLGSHQGVLKVY